MRRRAPLAENLDKAARLLNYLRPFRSGKNPAADGQASRKQSNTAQRNPVNARHLLLLLLLGRLRSLTVAEEGALS